MIPYVPPSMMDPERLSAAGLGSEAEMLARLLGTNAVFGGQQPAAQPAQAAPTQAPAQMAQMQPQGGGGGFLDGIRNFLDGGQGQKVNQTVQWLQQQGLDAGTSQALARNPGLLQDFLKQKMDPLAPLQQEKLGLEIDQMRNPRMDPGEEARLGLDRQKFDFERSNADRTQDIKEYQFAKRNGFEGSFAEWKNSGRAQPSAIQEYEYARQQGFPGTFQDWEASKKGGMSLQVDPETGAISFQQGANIKPMTEGQSKDTVYATRAEGSLPLIDQYGEALTRFDESVGDRVPFVGNYMTSDEYQQAKQAGNEFLQAILRKDTGAAIQSYEIESYGRTYLPMPGDGPPVLEQKRAARRRALEALKAGMPPQAILAQEKALARTGEATTGSPQPGMVEDGYRFKGGDPGNPASWERVQ
jgi:hypothetical protein